MNKFQQYVVGFLFDEERSRVVLIKKNKPAWQEGKWNGVGGKIERWESSREAMIREFEEEAGQHINSWVKFASLNGESFQVHMFCSVTFNPVIEKVRSMTDEEVKVFPINDLPENTVSNLKWLIPMANNLYEDCEFKTAEIFYR